MVWIIPILAFLSVESKDFFYSLVLFFLFGISLSIFSFLNGHIYLGIFQIGITLGTIMLSLFLEVIE